MCVWFNLGETFCHTLHIMDSKGTSVLVNKKCTTDRECQRTKVGCVEIDSQKVSKIIVNCFTCALNCSMNNLFNNIYVILLVIFAQQTYTDAILHIN